MFYDSRVRCTGQRPVMPTTGIRNDDANVPAFFFLRQLTESRRRGRFARGTRRRRRARHRTSECRDDEIEHDYFVPARISAFVRIFVTIHACPPTAANRLRRRSLPGIRTGFAYICK